MGISYGNAMAICKPIEFPAGDTRCSGIVSVKTSTWSRHHGKLPLGLFAAKTSNRTEYIRNFHSELPYTRTSTRLYSIFHSNSLRVKLPLGSHLSSDFHSIVCELPLETSRILKLPVESRSISLIIHSKRTI